MLEAHVETNIANYEFEMTPEAGGVVRSFSISGDETNSDRVYDPATGKAIMYGSHFDEIFEVQLTSVIEGANGVLKTAQITQVMNLATDLAMAGHVNNAGTVVCTGLSKQHDLGTFATQETRANLLPF